MSSSEVQRHDEDDGSEMLPINTSQSATNVPKNSDEESNQAGAENNNNNLAPTAALPFHWLVAISRLGFFMMCLTLVGSVVATGGGVALLSSIRNFCFSSCLILAGPGIAATTVGIILLCVTSVALVVTFRRGNSVVDFGLPQPAKDEEYVKVQGNYSGCEVSEDGGTAHHRTAEASHADFREWSCIRKSVHVVLAVVLPLLGALIVIALSIASLLLYTMSLQVAPYDKDYDGAKELKNGSIRIFRDQNGLAFIQAKSKYDALFGQGFVHAQDRLWQMEFMRLAAQGRLAEFVGSDALFMDKQTRILNFKGAGASMCSTLSKEVTLTIQSYVNGVNFFLNNERRRPPEFLFMSKKLLFFHEPEPFTLMDVCLTARLMQWQLSLNAAEEAERFNVFWYTNRSYAEVNELYNNYTNSSNPIVGAEVLNITEADCVNGRAREALDFNIEQQLYDTVMANLRSKQNPVRLSETSATHRNMEQPSTRGAAVEGRKNQKMNIMSLKRRRASNAWASKSTDGPAIGASDPHLGINLPSVWYWCNLSFIDSDGVPFYSSGVGLTGIPGIHIAKTSYVSWGITMSMTDLEDLILLDVDPTDPTKYVVNQTSIPLAIRTEVIKVKGEADIHLQVEESIFGPVVTDSFDLPSGLRFALTARPLAPDNTSAEGLLTMLDPTIRTARQLRDRGFALLNSPGLSIPIADISGSIGYSMTGLHYIRSPGHTGKFPTFGNGSFAYRGDIPFQQLPTIIKEDPNGNESFATSAANQRIHPDGYPYTLGNDYDWNYRGRRIQELLLEQAVSGNPSNLSSIDFHQRVQSDVASGVWRYDFRGFLNSTAPNAKAFQTLLTPAGSAMLQELLHVWDGRSSRGSLHTTMLVFFIRELASLPTDAIAALRHSQHSDTSYWNPLGQYPLKILQQPTPIMLRQCYHRLEPNYAALGPQDTTSCVRFAAQSWNKVAAISSSLPVWGVSANKLVGTHLMMHGSPLDCLFERSMFKDGDFSTVNVADFTSGLEGEVTSKEASSMRQLYNWGQKANPTTQRMWPPNQNSVQSNVPEAMRFVLPGGNSGNPYSPWYDNMWEAFRMERYTLMGGGLAEDTSGGEQRISG